METFLGKVNKYKSTKWADASQNFMGMNDRIIRTLPFENLSSITIERKNKL